jgi:hypothetical protein
MTANTGTLGRRRAGLANLDRMLAAEIWHWWIGVILVAVGILSVLGLGVQYLKNVTAKQYPNRRQRRDG